MIEGLRILRLTAELHQASRDPELWPAVFSELCSLLDCADVFGQGFIPDSGDPTTIIAECKQRAHACAAASLGRCGSGESADETKRMTCLAIVEHLDVALANTSLNRSEKRRDVTMTALDTIARPLVVCDSNWQLVHANQAGREEISLGRWFRSEGGRIHIGTTAFERRLQRQIEQLSDSIDGQRTHLRLPPANGQLGELWIRRLLRRADSPNLYLFSVVVTETDPAKTGGESHGSLIGASPRQRELAHLLLNGLSLTACASQMGISRATANGHLKALFNLSDTRRQSELVGWLTRAMHV
jgi:DNA-binding CsgD family transcriptional regulator